MGGKMSRNKGATGEREVAKILREHGFDGARRGCQYCGAAGDADVVGLPGFHLEVKRVEAFQLDKSMEQAVRDKRDGEIPVVVHRKNGTQWKAVLYLDDFLNLVGRDKDVVNDYKNNKA